MYEIVWYSFCEIAMRFIVGHGYPNILGSVQTSFMLQIIHDSLDRPTAVKDVVYNQQAVLLLNILNQIV